MGCGAQEQPQMTPDEVVKEGVKNLYEVNSGEYEINLKGEAVGAEGMTPQNIDFDVNLEGIFDYSSKILPKYTMRLNGAAIVDGGSEESLSLELRLDNENMYVYISEVPSLDGALPAEMVELFADQWWSLPIPEEAKAAAQAAMEEADAGMERELTAEEKQMKELVENTTFFGNLKFKGTEKVAGVDSYRYSAELDKEALKDFMTSAASMQGQVVSSADIENLNAMLEATYLPVDVWVGVEDLILRKVEGVMEVTPEDAGTMDLEFELVLSSLGEDVEIQSPQDAQEFDPMMMFGGMGAMDSMGEMGEMGEMPEMQMPDVQMPATY